MDTIESHVQELFFYSSTISLILFVWFKSNAFVEYCSLFRFKKLFYIKDFDKQREINPDLSYSDYLVIYRDSFFSRLISCPLCSSMWLGILFYFIHFQFLLLPTTIVLGLLIYFLAALLERKAYE